MRHPSSSQAPQFRLLKFNCNNLVNLSSLSEKLLSCFCLLGPGELYFPTKLHESLAKNVRRENGLQKKLEHWWPIFVYLVQSLLQTIGQRLEIHYSGTPVQQPLRKLRVVQRGAVNIKFCVSSVANCP